MLVGRYLGTFIGVLLASAFPVHDLWQIAVFWILFAAIGTVAGMLISMLLGINLDTDQPVAQDSLQYWIDKYGETLGKDAYYLWLEESEENPKN